MMRRRHSSSPATSCGLFFQETTSRRSVRQVKLGDHLALAVRVGKTRLIDNGSLR